jgi:hypothetical protein
VRRHHSTAKSQPPPLLSLTGRYLPFLYHLLAALLSPPSSYAVVLIDATHRFDVTRLAVERHHLRHLHVYRPACSSSQSAQPQIRACLDAARAHMVYGRHASRDRVWWGTVVVGGAGGDVNCGWRGWMDCQRREVPGFGLGMSVEEALGDRERRQDEVERRGWEGRSRVGVYGWGGKGEGEGEGEGR